MDSKTINQPFFSFKILKGFTSLAVLSILFVGHSRALTIMDGTPKKIISFHQQSWKLGFQDDHKKIAKAEYHDYEGVSADFPVDDNLLPISGSYLTS